MLRLLPLHLGLIVGALATVLLCPAKTSIAQAPPLTPDQMQETPIEIVPESEAFKTAINDFREHLKKMREVIVRFHVGTGVEEDQKRKREWIELQSEGTALHQAMVDAAIVEYRANPADKKDLAKFLFKILDRNVKADRFEGTIEIAQALLDNNYPDPTIPNFLAMAAFALNKYEIAKPVLDDLIEKGLVTDLLKEIHAKFDQIVADWQTELRLREEDAKGEPLPRILLRTTKGDMEIELFENQAPETVGNFLSLVESGFYEHLTFHQVLEHFMAQTGCPLGDGTGNPGYTIYGEMKKPYARQFYRGTLGLALANSPDTGGSQFFITFLPVEQLNGVYTAFGRVTKGMEVLANLQRINPDAEDKDKEDKAPVMLDEILEIQILNKRNHAYLPNKVVK